MKKLLLSFLIGGITTAILSTIACIANKMIYVGLVVLCILFWSILCAYLISKEQKGKKDA